jgi:hypothetical protein
LKELAEPADPKTGAGSILKSPETPPETPVDPCKELETRLPYLPEIMDKLLWTKGAALMRDWFKRSKNDKPKDDKTPNIDTIKMDWVLRYKRAKEVYDQAVSENVWANGPAQTVIKDQLIIGKGKLPTNVGDVVAFGDVGAGRILTPEQMKQFDKDYAFQQRQVFSDINDDPLDDLFAALGNFNFNFVTRGTVERLPDDANGKSRYRVTLHEVGIYVKDSYDFNDDDAWYKPSQPLGFWSCVKQDVSKDKGKIIDFDYKYVDNEDFRDWRDQYGKGKGGDFLVFSDIKVFTVFNTFIFIK